MIYLLSLISSGSMITGPGSGSNSGISIGLTTSSFSNFSSLSFLNISFHSSAVI